MISKCNQILVTSSQAAAHLAIARVPSRQVFSSNLNVFPLEEWQALSVLQSRTHEVWVRLFGGAMKDDLSYTPTTCFETFPFPENWETDPTLEAVGKEYYEFRAALMVRNNQGLTDTYNRFHDPDERDSDILKLRELHAKMDRAVLDAYGWTDIPTACEFLLDYEEEEDESNSRRKKPWRYRWPEEVHDEVLARLLDLNQKRHEAEILGGKHAETKAKSKKSRKPKATKSTQTNVQQPSLFGE